MSNRENYQDCNVCGLSYKNKYSYEHSISNNHLAALNQWYCQRCKKHINLNEKDEHLQSFNHKQKINESKWYCKECDKTLLKTSMERHLNSQIHKMVLERMKIPNDFSTNISEINN